MNFGFDLERTLDAEPDAFRAMCSALIAAGHEVHVITGMFPGATSARRWAQLDAIGFVQDRDFTDLWCCPGMTAEEVGDGKRDVCERLGIALMFDDARTSSTAFAIRRAACSSYPRSNPMPILYNVSAQYLQPDGPESKSVAPGEGAEFTDEQAASAGCEWSTEDPRAGLPAEKAFKAKRDGKTETQTEASPAPEDTESGTPGDTKEN